MSRENIVNTMKSPRSWLVPILGIGLSLGFTLSLNADALQSPERQAEPSKNLVEFERDVAPVLKQRCMTCHSGEAAKGGFEIADREALMGYIEPGKATESSLWTDYLTQPHKSKDAKSSVMPPDGPLPRSELALIHLWINEGAHWPETYSLSLKKESEQPVTSERSWYYRAYLAMGNFHPAIVHFPIVLFVLSGACAILSPFMGLRCQSIAFQCLVLATLISIVTVVMGWSFASSRGLPSWERMLQHNSTTEEQNFFYHRWLGTSIPILGVICVLLGMFGRRTKSTALNNIWRIGAILLAAGVCLVGHQGGALVYGDLLQKAMEQFSH